MKQRSRNPFLVAGSQTCGRCSRSDRSWWWGGWRCNSGRSLIVWVDTSGLALSAFASLYCVITYVMYYMYYMSYMHHASYIVCISKVPPLPCFSYSTGRAHWGYGLQPSRPGSCPRRTWYVAVSMIQFCGLKKWALVHNEVFILQQMRT